MATVARLPAYPSTHVRERMSPSELAALDRTVGSALLHTLALPPARIDTPAARAFVASYANHAAQSTLQALIWGDHAHPRPSPDQRAIRSRVLQLAVKLAAALDLLTLTDLAVVYAATHRSSLHPVFAAHAAALLAPLENDAVPAFTARLLDDRGLYAVRKTAYTLAALLQSLPHPLRRPFFRSKPFMMALARAYDAGLGAIAHSYGGLSLAALQPPQGSAQLDDWIPLWIRTKVDLLDAFHVLVSAMLHDLSVPTDPASLAQAAESAFAVVFALLDVPPSQSAPAPSTTPFLNRPIVADYQHVYDLADTLHRELKAGPGADDARLDVLEATLKAFDEGTGGKGSPGALSFLVRSSGVPPGIGTRGDAPPVASNGKGKARAVQEEPPDIDIELDSKTTSVLDILPDQHPSYIRALLLHPPYARNPEAVVAALLEGTAPSEAELAPPAPTTTAAPYAEPPSEFAYTESRRNVFDDEVLDVSKLRVGKKNEDAQIARDRTFIEQYKADILRRVEEMDLEDEDEDEDAGAGAGRRAGVDAGSDVEEGIDLLNAVGVKVSGDGEQSGDEDEDEDEDDETGPPQPASSETILELAYIQNPALFDRDGQTRRSKARADLKAQTHWSDEQIEGWRIMLERNPKKDKILQKHDFAGNRPLEGEPPSAQAFASGSGGVRGRGGPGRGGRGRGGGGGGRGGRGGGSGGGGGEARDRAWKDKNKASKANHNRKRGHDKKMARGGGGFAEP